MKISREQLLEESQATGFRPDMQEKVILLINLLNQFNEDRYLRDRLALKGGTALNLFLFDLPRLSVDIDLNYIGAVDRETMEKERPKVGQQLVAICQQQGFKIKRQPSDHAGGKYVLGYESALGSTQNLQVDLNYMYRSPLFGIDRRDSKSLGSFSANQIPILSSLELAAGKVAALIGRTASRDLFDVCQFETILNLKDPNFRLACVLYGSMSPKDWRKVTAGDIKIDNPELREKLIPVLRNSQQTSLEQFSNDLRTQGASCLSALFPLNEKELEFIGLLRDKGSIVPDLLTDKEDLQTTISQHPALLWRALKSRDRDS